MFVVVVTDRSRLIGSETISLFEHATGRPMSGNHSDGNRTSDHIWRIEDIGEGEKNYPARRRLVFPGVTVPEIVGVVSRRRRGAG